jgi:YVTN family beta-propeller protein
MAGDLPIAQSGDQLYVANFREGTVTVVDTRTLTVAATVPVGQGPGALAISPAGDRLYIACRWTQAIVIVDTRTREVLNSIDTETSCARPGVSLGVATSRPEPYAIAASHDGALLLVALWEPGTVIVIDTATERLVEEHDLGGGTHGRGPVDIVADPIDDRWYVTCAANAVVVLEQ